jgi:hypothetical protein
LPHIFFICVSESHEVPRVAIFDDVAYDVIMTLFADLPGKFENSYIVSHSSNHNSDSDKNTAFIFDCSMPWICISKTIRKTVAYIILFKNPTRDILFTQNEINVPSVIFHDDGNATSHGSILYVTYAKRNVCHKKVKICRYIVHIYHILEWLIQGWNHICGVVVSLLAWSVEVHGFKTIISVFGQYSFVTFLFTSCYCLFVVYCFSLFFYLFVCF